MDKITLHLTPQFANINKPDTITFYHYRSGGKAYADKIHDLYTITSIHQYKPNVFYKCPSLSYNDNFFDYYRVIKQGMKNINYGREIFKKDDIVKTVNDYELNDEGLVVLRF